MIKLQLLHLFFLSDYKLKCFKTGENNSGNKWIQTVQLIGWGANKHRHINLTDGHTDMQKYGKASTLHWAYSPLPWLPVPAKNICLIKDGNELNALSSADDMKFELANGGANPEK